MIVRPDGDQDNLDGSGSPDRLPLHLCTKALMSAALPPHPDIQQEEIILTGEVPSTLNPPEGRRFHTCCPFAMDRCSVEEPVLKEVGSNHFLSCHLYD